MPDCDVSGHKSEIEPQPAAWYSADMTARALAAITFTLVPAALQADPAAPVQAPAVEAKTDAARGAVTVNIGGQLFTELVYKGWPKPILYPVIGPGGQGMTRNWPVKEAAPGEAQDHPHHQSLWFNHGDVNGVDFWKAGDTAGKIVVEGEPVISSAAGKVTLTTKEAWNDPKGTVVCRSSTQITCGGEGEDRFIDYTITITASEGDVVFGDTKEGTMGIRTIPQLNLKGEVAKGTAVNSEGQKNLDTWGKNAKWVDYTGEVNGKLIGVACFDHPSNLRHPTTWHSRDYGLIAANPFGLHDFQKKGKGAGNHKIAKGESLTLKYRWLFHTGTTEAAKIAERWQAWAK